MARWPGLMQAETWYLIWASYTAQGPKARGPVFCFPRYISRDLDSKLSSWDLNQSYIKGHHCWGLGLPASPGVTKGDSLAIRNTRDKLVRKVFIQLFSPSGRFVKI